MIGDYPTSWRATHTYELEKVWTRRGLFENLNAAKPEGFPEELSNYQYWSLQDEEWAELPVLHGGVDVRGG